MTIRATLMITRTMPTTTTGSVDGQPTALPRVLARWPPTLGVA